MIARLAFVTAIAAVAVTTAAFAQTPSAPAKTATTAKGATLVDAKGMTLYTFDKDSGGKSACNGPCAKNWPPLSVASGAKPAGSWTVMARDDGSSQWAYKDKPLYTWSKDAKPGDVTGDGFMNGAWHVATP
jgi:predicted lipoprotein with Yx(FWY)xxD motif